MWRKGQCGNASGRPKKEETFKSYVEKWSKKIRKEITVDGKKVKIPGKEYSVVILLKMIQNDNTPDNIKLQAIKLLNDYTESKPAPEVINKVVVNNTEVTDRYLDDVKERLDKLSPEERELYLSITEKLNKDD